MDPDGKAEALAQIGRVEELIDISTKRIERAAALVKQSRRLMGYQVDREGTNHRTAAPRAWTTTKYKRDPNFRSPQ